VQTSLLYGKKLYLYGGLIEENLIPFKASRAGEIVAQRDGAVLVLTADGKGIWITHVRRLKPKNQALLPAKLPAMLGLKSVPELASEVDFDAIPTWNLTGFTKVPGTFQEVWIEYDDFYGAFKTAYIYSKLVTHPFSAHLIHFAYVHFALQLLQWGCFYGTMPATLGSNQRSDQSIECQGACPDGRRLLEQRHSSGRLLNRRCTGKLEKYQCNQRLC
jgi:hypothetical protein